MDRQSARDIWIEWMKWLSIYLSLYLSLYLSVYLFISLIYLSNLSPLGRGRHSFTIPHRPYRPGHRSLSIYQPIDLNIDISLHRSHYRYINRSIDLLCLKLYKNFLIFFDFSFCLNFLCLRVNNPINHISITLFLLFCLSISIKINMCYLFSRSIYP